jgi:hypothetical protein
MKLARAGVVFVTRSGLGVGIAAGTFHPEPFQCE